MTCEQCGADAVDLTGTCQQCGWRAGGAPFPGDDDAPSYAETRAADALPVARTPLSARHDAPAPPPLAASTRTRATPPPPTPGAPPNRPSRGPATGRYCGTCGGRIDPGMQFCGQCGTPVFAEVGGDAGTAYRPTQFSAPGYQASGADMWMPADNEAPTVEFPEMLQGNVPGYAGRMGPGSAYPASKSGNRELKVVFGILCILGGLVSGAGAIILALAPPR